MRCSDQPEVNVRLFVKIMTNVWRMLCLYFNVYIIFIYCLEMSVAYHATYTLQWLKVYFHARWDVLLYCVPF